MKKLIVTLVLVVGIMAALSAFEGMKEHKGKDNEHCQGMKQKNMEKHHKMGDGFGMLMAELEFTDAQKEQFEDLKIKHQKSVIQLKADIDILKIDKQAAMRNHNFGKMKKKVGSIFELKKEIAIKQVTHHEAMWNILTAEQKDQAEKLMKDKPHSKKMKHKKFKKGNN